MSRPLHVHLLPALTSAESLRGATVVVIDVLRATTTITQAIAAGAAMVIPCLEIEDAAPLAAKLPSGEALMGGERGGLPIAGFDLGNSPSDYSSQRVAGKTIVFTTTNGTKAMQHCGQAQRVLIGAFVNLSAVVRAVRDAESVHLLCAGTGGVVALEDSLFAGAVASQLLMLADDWEPNDQASLAAQAAGPREHLSEAVVHGWLAKSRGGRNLRRIGLEADIAFASQIDIFDFAAALDIAAWRITRD